jgi:hypothetical protein
LAFSFMNLWPNNKLFGCPVCYTCEIKSGIWTREWNMDCSSCRTIPFARVISKIWKSVPNSSTIPS